ncbi:MAG: CDP-alcohol phosphatidyltransferase family protein [Candidatus Paceibacterota bacterium]
MPNALSAFRVLAAILVLYFSVTGAWVAVFALIICGYLSDLLDGPIARRFNAESPHGKAIDLTADVVFDEAIVGGLVMTNQVGGWLAILAAAAIVIIRLPGFFSQRWIYWFGTIMLPIWSVCMLWLVGICIREAFGFRGLQIALITAIPTALIVAFLKRERITQDVKTFLTAFFSK